MGANKYDFSGWVTKNGVKCSDGLTICHDAFASSDGKTVPLVWRHMHDDPFNVLGKVKLENRAEGVYGYGSFNNSEGGLQAREIVQHGDITSMSIFANKIRRNGSDVIHGDIKEVSLVINPANPAAKIDFCVLEHEDGSTEESDEAIVEFGVPVVHEDNEETKDNSKMEEGDELAHEDDDDDDEEFDVEEIFKSLTDKQKLAVAAIYDELLKEDTGDVEHSDEGDNSMKRNVFDNEGRNDQNTLTHEEQVEIIKDAKRYGSLKESFIAHEGEDPTYGITNIDYLFPDAKSVTEVPITINYPTEWVGKVMRGVKRSPFKNVKTVIADLTGDAARALGYSKGKLKKEEVLALMKRVTPPQTIYKKQKLDRDDILDIEDMDIVAWLKNEMRGKLDEEIARAILIGDGRNPVSDDKISEEHIRPIFNDADLYTIKSVVDAGENADTVDYAKEMIKQAVRARKDYRGSGNPTLFTTEEWLTEMLLLEDDIGRSLYSSANELATKMRVSDISTVTPMENLTLSITKNNVTTVYDVMGIIVNLSDYNVGADRRSQVSFFEDFDIDYNQEKYLIETRMSGALVRPYSAIVLLKVHA